MINPVSLPTSAGVNFGEGDVRHFSEGDEVGVPGLQGPTRQLAQRDNLLASKVNELISRVNNQEQFISVPVNRMIVPPSSEEIIANFRIPAGYEARVFNATVFSSPASSSIELTVSYSEVIGSNSGEAAVTTSSEFFTGTRFYPEGEFIIVVKNTGAVTLDMGASVTLSMRPLEDAVVASYQTSPPTVPGPPGPRGATGAQGVGGVSGPSGSPGLQWKGDWANATNYAVNDIVRHKYLGDGAGTVAVSSYICQIAHDSADVGKPQPYLLDQSPSAMPWWGYLAEAGAPVQIEFKGPWSGTHGTYHINDVVTYVSSGATSSYICIVTHASAPTPAPPSDPTNWTVFATSSASSTSFSGPTTRRGFLLSSSTSKPYREYEGIPTGAQHWPIDEHTVSSATGGLSFIKDQRLLNLPPSSTLLLMLPSYSNVYNVPRQWQVSDVILNVIPQVGTILGGGTVTVQSPLDVTGNGTGSFLVENLTEYYLPVTVSLAGVTTF